MFKVQGKVGKLHVNILRLRNGWVRIEIGRLPCYRWHVSSKLKSLSELKQIVAQGKNDGKKIVFTNGCFDILHRGHVHLLRQARTFGDMVIVGLNSDKSVKAIKGPDRPVLPEADRVELITAMEMVDYVVLFDEPDPYKLIAVLRPNVLAKGGDWSEGQVVGADVVEKDGGEVRIVPYLKGFSTTEIIAKILKKDPDASTGSP